MKSLGMTAYTSIVTNESYFGLLKAINELQEEISKRTILVKEKLDEYINSDEDDKLVDFYIQNIRERCSGSLCSGCKTSHYPVVTFRLFFANHEDEFFVELIIKKSSAMVIIENSQSTSLVVRAKRDLDKNDWNIDLRDDLLAEVKEFLDHIDIMIDIYLDVLK